MRKTFEQIKINGKNHPVIYVVTSIDSMRKPLDSRAWGWVPTLKEAEEVIENNSGDIQECSYTHAVIEKVVWGIPNVCVDEKNETWYKWHTNKGKWEKCSKPQWAKCVVGWGLG